MKFKTVKEGEQAVVFNHLGEGRIVVGPQRIYLYRERCQFMKQYTATPSEYLVVQYKSGEIIHIPGPCEMFLNPLEHQSVLVERAIHIDSNHILVVYRKLKDSTVERRVIQGPTMFFPSADEWTHKFEWHGADPAQIGRMIPKKAKCTQLASIPDQFYYNVRDVRTKDDTMLQVNLMIFYQLKDVIQMLETTHDPIADMINAVCADVIAFAGKKTFVGFLENISELAKLDSYPQLLQRAERVGYQVAKVVYRGYKASDQLQTMQDGAIQSRTQLRLDSELAEQKQKLADFQLQKERERTEMRQRMEKSKTEHQQKIEQMKQEHELRMKEMSHRVDLDIKNMHSKAQLECKSARLNDETRFLQQLQALDVHITEYLLTRSATPIEHEYRIVSHDQRTAITDVF